MSMGDVENIIGDIGDKMGWNETTKLGLCLEYISN